MIQFKQNKFFNAEILGRKRIFSINMMTSRIGDIFLFIGAGISGDGEAVVAGLGSGSPPPGGWQGGHGADSQAQHTSSGSTVQDRPS